MRVARQSHQTRPLHYSQRISSLHQTLTIRTQGDIVVERETDIYIQVFAQPTGRPALFLQCVSWHIITISSYMSIHGHMYAHMQHVDIWTHGHTHAALGIPVSTDVPFLFCEVLFRSDTQDLSGFQNFHIHKPCEMIIHWCLRVHVYTPSTTFMHAILYFPCSTEKAAS